VDDPLTAHEACQSASLGRTHWAHLARGFDKTRLNLGSSKTEFFSVAASCRPPGTAKFSDPDKRAVLALVLKHFNA
jgi:hypothetical protein